MKILPPDTAIPADDARQARAASHPDRRSGHPGDDVVRWREFRLALGIGGFALALAGCGSAGGTHSEPAPDPEPEPIPRQAAPPGKGLQLELTPVSDLTSVACSRPMLM